MKELLATRLKVTSALFLSSFIIWLALILLVSQPTDNLGQIQFSNFALLALFLGSATAASLASMLIGLDLLELKMKPISLKKKFGRGQVTLQTRKSIPTVQLEELHLSKHSLSISDPKVISCPNCSKVFKTPLLILDFSGSKNRLVRRCPYCNFSIENFKDGQTAPTRCHYWFGYLAKKEYGEPIPNECIECEKVMDCLLEKEVFSTEAVNEIKKWLH